MKPRAEAVGSDLVVARTTQRRARWPRKVRRVRASAVPGEPWPHTTPWEWQMVSAYRDGRLVGYALLRIFFDGEVDFNDLAVHSDHQRQGCGTALCNEAIAWMRELECTEISALPTSNEGRRLFERLGFEEGPLAGALTLRLR